MIDAGADDQAQRLEARRFDQQILIDRKIAGEQAGVPGAPRMLCKRSRACWGNCCWGYALRRHASGWGKVLGWATGRWNARGLVGRKLCIIYSSSQYIQPIGWPYYVVFAADAQEAWLTPSSTVIIP